MGAHFARRLAEAGAQVAAGDVNEAMLRELPKKVSWALVEPFDGLPTFRATSNPSAVASDGPPPPPASGATAAAPPAVAERHLAGWVPVSALAEDPYNGFMQALVRARIPYVPVHADHIARDGGALSVLVLPNLAAMSAAQCEAVRRYVAGGGALIATGVTSLYDEWGDAHADFALADLFGAHLAGGKLGTAEAPERQWAAETAHSYLRLSPELRARVWGPKAAGEPPATGTRHAVLRGFDETDIMAFGGMLEPLRVDSGAVIPLTFVPPFPIFPPETSYMRVPKTDIPGLVLKGKVAYLAADIDRRFARDGLPDHGDLLANLVRWAAGAGLPLEFTGPGLIDCNLYTQPSRAILHAVNLTNSATRGPLEELLPVGPFTVRLRLPAGVSGRRARLLVADRAVATKVAQGWAAFSIESILDHEVVLVE